MVIILFSGIHLLRQPARSPLRAQSSVFLIHNDADTAKTRCHNRLLLTANSTVCTDLSQLLRIDFTHAFTMSADAPQK